MARGYSRSLGLSALLCLSACAVADTIETLDDASPPPEFGRPAWVRVCAGAGAWIGGIGGGIVSIVLLPITWPISELAGDGLGEHSASEFMFFPALGGASLGHCLLGTPPDVLDWLFRRAWSDDDGVVKHYDFVPMPGPAIPRTQTPASETK
ncbi:MAG: hypothetical protein JNK78_10750 [Planctomycetes bacterium]|nr:hypothetical protein [Planctomycetota bacterium]